MHLLLKSKKQNKTRKKKGERKKPAENGKLKKNNPILLINNFIHFVVGRSEMKLSYLYRHF